MVSVFIADDNEMDRKILESVLLKKGFTTRVFDSGLSVYNAILESRQPIIVLLDWMMPDKTGVEICQKLLAEPSPSPIYTILLTGKTEKTAIAYALEKGADDYITKPFNSTELKARIDVGIRLLSFRQQLIESNARMIEYTKQVENLAETRAQQLIQADRLSTIGMLSAGIAHEINNPCSFIAVNIQTLEDSCPLLTEGLAASATEDMKKNACQALTMIPEIIGEMKNGVIRIKKIVNGLKTYAHPVSGEKKWVDIESCLETALHLCENRLKYHVQVRKEFKETPEVFGDQLQLEQVFINLFANAADAIEETGKDGILTVASSHENESVILKIRNDGPNMSSAVLEKIFLPFHTTKPVGKGTGLGLLISQNIIKAHNGTIEVENIPGGGVQFTVLLPAKRKAAMSCDLAENPGLQSNQGPEG